MHNATLNTEGNHQVEGLISHEDNQAELLVYTDTVHGHPRTSGESFGSILH